MLIVYFLGLYLVVIGVIIWVVIRQARDLGATKKTSLATTDKKVSSDKFHSRALRWILWVSTLGIYSKREKEKVWHYLTPEERKAWRQRRREEAQHTTAMAMLAAAQAAAAVAASITTNIDIGADDADNNEHNEEDDCGPSSSGNEETEGYDSDDSDYSDDHDNGKLLNRHMAMSNDTHSKSFRANKGFNIQLSIEDSEQMVYGLINTGNSCFLNSVLQALASSEYLQLYLTDVLECMDSINGRLAGVTIQASVTETLWETLCDINTTVKRDSSFQPFSMLTALNSKGKITDREQQDAQEAFQLISTSISEERLDIKRMLLPSLFNMDYTDNNNNNLDAGWKNGLIQGNTRDLVIKGSKTDSSFLNLPQSPFSGLIASRLSCTQCGYTEAVRHFGFDNISLTLPLTETCTLGQALSRFVGIEELYDVICRKCSLKKTLGLIITKINEIRGYISGNSNNPLVERYCGDSDLLPKKTAMQLKKRILLLESCDDGQSSSDDSDFSDGEGSDESCENTSLINGPVGKMDFYNALSTALRSQAEIVINALKTNVQQDLGGIELSRAYSPVSTKQVMFAKLPLTMCLHLSRSAITPDGMIVKNPCHVVFPEILDFSPYTTTGHLQTDPCAPISSITEPQNTDLGTRSNLGTPSPGSQPCLYRLQAAVVHIGSHSYGHFITYRRRPVLPPHLLSSGRSTPFMSSVSLVSLANDCSTRDSVFLDNPSLRESPEIDITAMAKRPGYPGQSSKDKGRPKGLDKHKNAKRKRGWKQAENMSAEWYLISDEDVQPVSLDTVLSANPYLLVYEQLPSPLTSR
ncbi:ubiquitin-specific protease ubp1 [Mycoemilia scoparia]|uniref:ubiquitinyl hydrolase 1 n=1 Tax=Mycoemilia scoparia TaxID=417184 RepID=A0A9W7ZVM6_9FUNG|nr:ubiquitin-specific protease ubp1 [Mycoemilia scoparia]